MGGVLDRLRSGPARTVIQLGIIAALFVVAWQVYGLRSDNEKAEAQSQAVNAILAQSCGAASFDELRASGLVEECRLSQDGDLVDAIPDSDLPSPGTAVEDVPADVVEDDDTSTPADIAPPSGTIPDSRIAAQVDDYFEGNPLTTQPGYQRAISRTVAAFLTANPPDPGRPPTEREIRGAVVTALLANPPAPGVDGTSGTDGADGRSVVAAALDGCDVVFTYSDTTSDRVGPVCGADGEPGPAPTDTQIAQAVVAYCTTNGECRGPAGPPGVVRVLDNCEPEPGRVVSNVDLSDPVGDPATITLSCDTVAGPLLGGDPEPADG